MASSFRNGLPAGHRAPQIPMQTIHANAAQVSLRRDVECLPESELQAASADADGRGQFINASRLTERLRNVECASACRVRAKPGVKAKAGVTI
jgi:hypothetical protein